MPGKISKDDHDDIVERAIEGESLSSIGNDYDVSRATIEYHVKGFCSHADGPSGWPKGEDRDSKEDEDDEPAEEEEEEVVKGPPETFEDAEARGMYQSGPVPGEESEEPDEDEEDDDKEHNLTLRDTDPEERPEEEVEELLNPNRVDIFRMLSSERRRNVIRALGRLGDETNIGDLSEMTAALEYNKDIREVTSKERKRVYVGLYQTHLDQMDDAGILDWESDRGYVDVSVRDINTVIDVMEMIEDIDGVNNNIVVRNNIIVRSADGVTGMCGLLYRKFIDAISG